LQYAKTANLYKQINDFKLGFSKLSQYRLSSKSSVAGVRFLHSFLARHWQRSDRTAFKPSYHLSNHSKMETLCQ